MTVLRLVQQFAMFAASNFLGVESHIHMGASNKKNTMQPPGTGMFDIPARSTEEIKAIVESELPHIRQSLRMGKRDMEEKKRSYASSQQHTEANAKAKAQRMAERREKARKLIKDHQPESEDIKRLTHADMKHLHDTVVKNDPNLENENNHWLRGLGGNYRYSGQSPDYLAPVDEYYDQWAQAYRMLGGFIDCDAEGGSGSGDGAGCSRWMMWAAYVNPNYNGGGRAEYFSYGGNYYDDGNDQQSDSNLDCHSSSTEWKLIGVYRQEFYQFLEQISKHLWAIDDYEYVTALAGLAYMTDDDCYGIGYDNSGNYLYAGVMPTSGGSYQMGLYVDNACIYPDTESGLTFDDFGMTNDMDLGSEDDGTLDDDTLQTLYGYWTNTQEYTLSALNEVYKEYKYCTLCMDYPTYQDGYFIGDDGTDDDDLINQCWKFHSHDSYTCEAECIALGDAQGTILQVNYDGVNYGKSWDGSSGSGSDTSYDHYSKSYGGGKNSVSNFAKFKANAFLTINGVLFIATFLAFSVARGTRLDSSEKSRSLLSKSQRRSARSTSGSKKSRTKSKRKSSSSKKKSTSSEVRTSTGKKPVRSPPSK